MSAITCCRRKIFARVTPAQKLDNVLAGGFAGPVDLLDLWRDKKRPAVEVAPGRAPQQAVESRMEAHRSIIEVLSRRIAACKATTARIAPSSMNSAESAHASPKSRPFRRRQQSLPAERRLLTPGGARRSCRQAALKFTTAVPRHR